jgi:two-component system response regulator GlrR
MTRRVTVIESPGSPFAAGGTPLAPEVLASDCQRIAWSDLSLDRLSACRADLLVTVAVPEPPDATRVFRWLADHPVRAATFAVLPHGCAHDLLRVTAQAVDDFVLWPARGDEVRERISRVGFLRHAALEGVMESVALAQMVGRDPAFVELVGRLPRIAAADATVLLTGETGTGKELCARALHFLSRRRAAPFIPVDCGALPDSLFESEVFGHTRGAFTDARSEQRGLVAMAEGGTVFLDEVDALSPGTQAKLLRFLEEHTYRPLGSERFARADVAVICATNQDLERLVRDGRFRSDLFFRLSGLRLRLPPLRERPIDIELLARHFLEHHQPHDGTPPRVLGNAGVRALQSYPWPGNIRELANVIRSAVVFSTRRQILPEDLALPVATAAPGPGARYRHLRASVVAAFERSFLEDLLRRHRGNLTHASREAGQDRRALGRLARKHAIDPQAFQ